MTGAELKVHLTGLGLSPLWLAERLGIATRTVIRWFDLDKVPDRAVEQIDVITAVTNEEIQRVFETAERTGVVRTQRVDTDDVAICNTLPAAWHRALTYRAILALRAGGTVFTVGYR